MIRTIIVLLDVIFFLLLGVPLLLLEWIIGIFSKKAQAKSSLAIVQFAFWIVAFLSGARVTTIGEENIPKGESVLYVANHRSYFDVILCYIRVPGLTGFVAKKEMLRYPLLRDWMKLLYCSFLDRKDIKQGFALIMQNVEYLKKGISVFVFPEGTRNKTEDILLPFHDGSLKMAEKSGRPIIPVTINNTEQILEAHMPRVKRANVTIEYGKPIYMNDMSREEKKQVSGQIQEIMKETYKKNANR